MHDLVFLGSVAGIYLPVLWSPGPNFVVVSKAAVSESRKHGVFTALGISSGTVVWVILAGTGVGLLFSHFVWARRAMQLLGGAYLLFLGLKIWKNSNRSVAGATSSNDDRRSIFKAYMSGLATSMTNPQSLVFFTSIFATLLTPELTVGIRMAGVGVIIAMSICSYLLQATMFAHEGMQKRYLKLKRPIDYFSGALLTFLGMKLVFS